MKYLKTYENMVNKLEIKNEYFWLLEPGNYSTVIKILDKIELKLNKHFLSNFGIVKSDLVNWTKEKFLGCYLYYNSNRFQYWVFNDEYDKRRADNYNIQSLYTFQGELKIENDKLVLDTLAITTKKYNL